MKNKLNTDFKYLTKKSLNREDIINIFKKEFNRCIHDKSLEPNMRYSIDNPVAMFEFIKKEK